MSNPELGAVYLGKVIWPFVLLGDLNLFRDPISGFIRLARRLETPIGHIEADTRESASRENENLSAMQDALTESIGGLLGDVDEAQALVDQAVFSDLSHTTSPLFLAGGMRLTFACYIDQTCFSRTS